MTDWQTKAKPICPGDTISLMPLYVRNMELPAEAAFRKGKAVRLESVCDTMVAIVDFGDELRRISVKGLERAGEKSR